MRADSSGRSDIKSDTPHTLESSDWEGGSCSGHVRALSVVRLAVRVEGYPRPQNGGR